ncbi:MAG: hypothetical protein L0Z46_06060 [Nitrospiraceae bacterium]|nr:hypothetical protein [Nitrospiraceae bacterium]
MPSEDDSTGLVPASDPKTLALEVAAFVTSAVPYIGGPVSNILSGVATARKLNRVRGVLESVAEDLKGFKSEITDRYVRTGEFEELLERTLRQAADERSEEKRRLYASFLRDDIKSPTGTYDEKLRFLRTMEELQPDHLLVLKALSAAPDANPGMMGSPSQTLSKRLPQMNEAQITELVSQLNDMRITNLGSLKVMMTGHGAADLRHSITQYGRRFVEYVLEA